MADEIPPSGSFPAIGTTPVLVDGEWQQSTILWVYGANGKGAWMAGPWLTEKNEIGSGQRQLPTVWEARRYAELMSQGTRDAAALMILLDERVTQVQEAAA